MPTLHITRVEESLSANRGDTASTADFALFSLSSSKNQLSTTNDKGEDSVDERRLNDTTLSGTLFDEALHILRMEKDATRLQEQSVESSSQAVGGCERASVEPPSASVVHSPPSINQNPSKKDAGSSQEFDELNFSCESFDRSPPALANTESTIGPQERLYREKYEGLVGNWIQQSRRELKDYRKLSNDEKELEQERVVRLLHRLGIGAPSCEKPLESPFPSRVKTTDDQGQEDLSRTCKKSFETSDRASDKTWATHSAEPKPSERKWQLTRIQSSVTFAVENDQSSILLSPSESKDHYRMGFKDSIDDSVSLLSPSPSVNPNRPTIANRSPPLYQESSVESMDSFSDDSIEAARLHDNACKSPAEAIPFHRKRSASTSGRRGNDASRARSLSPTSFGLPVATAPPNPFSASQSPISPYVTSGVGLQVGSNSPFGLAQVDVSFGDSSSQGETESPQNDSILFTEKASWGISHPLRECSNHVRLKDGSAFHLSPLEVRSTRHVSFPDPFHLYDKKQVRQLLRVYNKLQNREIAAFQRSNGIARAAVLSMEIPMLQDLVMKLIIESGADTPRNSSLNQGKTLILARDRLQLDEWSRTFREGSNLSVLNHSTLPVVQRKTRSTAEKCGKYDVVLSTYDCLKSPDVTMNVDANGFPSLKEGNQDGWHSRRSSQLEDVRCKQLSVLHCLIWRRIIFVDILGRKSYLIKPHTSRSLAARSLHSNARFVFLVGAQDSKSSDPTKILIEGEKKSVDSLSSVLRAKVDGCEREFLRHVVIDFCRRSRKQP